MQAAFGFRKTKATGWNKIGLYKPRVFRDMFFAAHNYLWALDGFEMVIG